MHLAHAKQKRCLDSSVQLLLQLGAKWT